MILKLEPKVLQSEKSSFSSSDTHSLLLTIEIPHFPLSLPTRIYEIRTLPRFIPDHVFWVFTGSFYSRLP